MKKNKVLAITAMSVMIGCGSYALADGFDPAAFQAEQINNITLEQSILTKTATQSIDDLQAFLKKNGMDNKDSLSDSDKTTSPFEAPAYQAPAPQIQQTNQRKSQTPNANNAPASQNTDNLPLNTDSNNEQTNRWNYKL